jgi:hypothetical protein
VIRGVKPGSLSGDELSHRRVVLRFEGFSFLTSQPLLEGERGDQADGGSGSVSWP